MFEEILGKKIGDYQIFKSLFIVHGLSPFPVGKHSIDVTYDGLPIPGSPFEVDVVPGNDPSQCKAYGPGLEKGHTNEPQQFTIETRKAGPGNLSLAVEGTVSLLMEWIWSQLMRW